MTPMGRLRSYGQYCGLAQALEIVGERWALLIVRDLVLGPKRFTDLRTGLPRIPTNVLSARLKELEAAGVVHRRTMPRPSAAVAYELTAYGSELEEVVLHLGRWGAKSLGDPKPEDIVTIDGEVLALRATFQEDAARGANARHQLQVAEVIVHAIVNDGTLTAGDGPLPDADLVMRTDALDGLKLLLSGDISATEAIASGLFTIEGPVAEFERFVELFGVGTQAVTAPA